MIRYLLRGVKVTRVNQVWSADITYVRLLGGFVYLVAVIDWYSRYALSWEVSTTMESECGCISRSTTKLRRRFTVSRLEKWTHSDPPYFR
jgi:putative transposase